MQCLDVLLWTTDSELSFHQAVALCSQRLVSADSLLIVVSQTSTCLDMRRGAVNTLRLSPLGGQRQKHNTQNNTCELRHCFPRQRSRNLHYLSQTITVTLLAMNRIVANVLLCLMAFKQLPDHPILVLLSRRRRDKIRNVCADNNLKFCHQILQITPPSFFLRLDIGKRYL